MRNPWKSAAAIAVTMLIAGQASASDYFHACKTVGGNYEIDDGVLSRAGDSSRTSIVYDTLYEAVLSQRKGYCVARGQRFGFEFKSYVMRVRFKENGSVIELDALCELAADGLPAAYKCEREVVTLDQKHGSSPPPAGSGGAATTWTHNGSIMKLEASGTSRRFVYLLPRRGMVEAGAKEGDVVFEGWREASTYRGTAYIFSRNCGRVGYPVAGRVGADDRSVQLEGQAPLLAANCTVRGYRRDTLLFQLVGG